MNSIGLAGWEHACSENEILDRAVGEILRLLRCTRNAAAQYTNCGVLFYGTPAKAEAS